MLEKIKLHITVAIFIMLYKCGNQSLVNYQS